MSYKQDIKHLKQKYQSFTTLLHNMVQKYNDNDRPEAVIDKINDDLNDKI